MFGGFFDGGAGGGKYDYTAYFAELERKRQQERLEEEAEQREIDNLPTLSERLERNRERYHCGDDYVTLADIPLWSETGKVLKLADAVGFEPPKPVSTYGRGMYNYGPPPAQVSALDRQRRFPVDAELNGKISIYRGDITSLEVDAIVNAANESLLGGGGIDGAIHSAAGPCLGEECRALRGCATGNTKITRGYKLPAQHVLHTVGPVGRGDGLLLSCYQTCFNLVLEHNLRSVALCCVGTGIYGFPLIRATHIALHTARTYLEGHKDSVDRIIFCVFRAEELDVYEKLVPSYFPVDDSFPAEACPPEKVVMFDAADRLTDRDFTSDDDADKEQKSKKLPAESAGAASSSAQGGAVSFGNGAAAPCTGDVFPNMNSDDYQWTTDSSESDAPWWVRNPPASTSRPAHSTSALPASSHEGTDEEPNYESASKDKPAPYADDDDDDMK